MLTSYYRYFLLIFLLLLAINAKATLVDDLYTAKVPVSKQNVRIRNAAIDKAFRAVLIKVSGNSNVANNATLKVAMSKAENFIQQYSYTNNENSNADAFPYLLTVDFAPNAINKLLLQAKLTVWGNDRPLILFWLATDIGGQQKLIGASDKSSIPSLIEQYADTRGMPVIFPVLDLTDLNQISATDVMAPFINSITQASVRYGSNVVAIVRFKKEVGQWQSYWTLVANGAPLNWQIKGKVLDAIIQSGINSISDTLAEQFALVGAAQQTKLNIKIEGINSVAAYKKVRQYLSRLAIVNQINLIQLSNNQLIFQLDIVGTVATLQGAIKLDHVLVPSGYALDLAALHNNVANNTASLVATNLTLAYKWTP